MSSHLKRVHRLDILLALLLLLLPLLWFAPQAMGGRTLLPADNLFSFAPWKSFAASLDVGVPHNGLISDLILENYEWKSLLAEALRSGQITGLLWNPRLFAGQPFLAAGQHSALYPLSLVFYILPLWRAYGVFTWLQLGLAGLGMYVFARLLSQRPAAAFLAAVAYAFSGFFIASVNFTMIIAAASWLPLILALIEIVIRKQEQKGTVPFSPVPYVAAGALLFAVQALAGHVEITYYVLLVSTFYAAWRLFGAWRRLGSWGPLLRAAAWLAAMVVLGLALAGVQLLPMYELLSRNFREGATSLRQVQDWAWPSRQIITFLLPDAFGNPTHHAYFDIWARTWLPVTHNALGQPLQTIDWGVKNYVEGANYLGLPTLLLALVAVFGAFFGRATAVRQARGKGWLRPATGRFYVVGFALLALLSLLFAFGTPLYAILYYLLPGYNQLHSAFRWVYPYTLSMALLAGFGLNWLLARPSSVETLPARARRAAGLLGWLAAAAGLAALLVVAASLVAPGPFIRAGDLLLRASDLARTNAFSDGRMAWSYEATGIARFGLLALLAGLALAWGVRRSSVRPPGAPPQPGLRVYALPAAMIVLLIADLWLFGHSFNSAVDPKLLAFKPPVMQWLQDHQDSAQPWRFTTFDDPNEKTLNANAAMPYGLEDVRGYDSAIPRQYAAYMQRIQPQGDLLYNRIAPIYTTVNGQPNYDALDSPLLALLGTRYVVTSHAIPNAGYSLVYDGEIKVYENTRAFPRAFIVSQALAAPDQKSALDMLATIDPAQTVVVEGLAPTDLPAASSPQLHEAHLSQRDARQVFVDVNLSDRGWLVFTDNFFDGWKAYLRPFGVAGEGVNAEGESLERELPVYRADGTFRAVYVDKPGQWTVRFVYSPRSILLGLYTSFLALVILLLVSGWWAWGRYYRGERSEVGTVAKNSVVQMVLSLLSKGIDFAFAMLRLRVLSPAGEGSYAFAIAFYSIFEILVRFGLGTLVTRDVALERNNARRYLVNVVSLRTGLWLLSLPLMFLVGLVYHLGGRLTGDEARAIIIFAGALFFANIHDAISAVFNAYEKMEYPAGIATAVAVAKVALSALVLLPPFEMGFVGLAGISLVMNVVQVIWLYVVLRQRVLVGAGGVPVVGSQESKVEPVGRPTPQSTGLRARQTLSRARLGLDWQLQLHMFRESGPLMINNLLATIFWRIDLYVLKAFAGAAAVGIFSAGVKYLDGLNVIPSYFTLAIFPLMSRYARSSSGSLVKAYRLAVQLLFIIALPVAVFFTFAATPLIQILGGAAYLPDSAIALRVMIWSIPIGFVNSVTQYVLIAVNQQRFLTRAFIVGVAFNAIANLVFVPRYGYLASAVILIPAELSLFIPFYWAVRRHVTEMPWLSLCGGPLLAAALNAGAVWGLQRIGVPLLLALALGFAVYLLALFLLGTFRGEEFSVLRARFARFRLWPGPRVS